MEHTQAILTKEINGTEICDFCETPTKATHKSIIGVGSSNHCQEHTAQGRQLAELEDSINERSTGHIATLGRYEYFEFNGQLYRALNSNPLDTRGIRQGARWQCPMSMAGDYIEQVKTSFEIGA
jgi:hypothetical protein